MQAPMQPATGTSGHGSPVSRGPVPDAFRRPRPRPATGLTLAGVMALAGLPAQATDLDGYLDRLSGHPSVRALERSAEAVDRRALAARGLPDPEIALGLNNVPVQDPAFDRFLPSNKSLSFTQRIPNPGRLRAESERLASEASVPRLEAAYQLARLEAQFLTALVERARIEEVDALLVRRAALYRQIDEVLASELASGLAVYADLAETDARLADVERRRNELAQARLEADSELLRLVDEVPALEPPGVSIDDSPDALGRAYPVRIARQSLEVASRAVAVSRADFLPSFGVSATYQQREAGPGFSGEDWFSVRATLTVPLWSSFRQQPGLVREQVAENAAQGDDHVDAGPAQFPERHQQPAYEGAVAARAATRSRADDATLTWRRRLEVLRGASATALRNVELIEEQRRLVAVAAEGARRNYESGLERLRSVLAAELELNLLEIEIAGERAQAKKLALEHNSHVAPAAASASAAQETRR